MHYLNMIYLHTLLKGALVSLRGVLFLLKGALFLFLHGATPATTTPTFNNLSFGSKHYGCFCIIYTINGPNWHKSEGGGSLAPPTPP